MEITDWYIAPSREAYEKAQQDERFQYIVALGRAVNALNFVRSIARLRSPEEDSPAAKRDRMNSYLFGSAIMYEALRLIRRLNRSFATDPIFQNGLRLLLKDKDAQAIEREHLDAVRNQAVFHFIPATFAAAIQKHLKHEKFCSGQGTTKGGVNFSYSDIIAAEILMGSYTDVDSGPDAIEKFNAVVARTNALTGQFVEHAENLIRHTLGDLGFELFMDRSQQPEVSSSQ